MHAAGLLRERGWRVDLAQGEAVAEALEAGRHAVAVVECDTHEPVRARLRAACAAHASRLQVLALCAPGDVYQLLHAESRPRAYACKPASAEQIATRVEALARGTGSNLDACLCAGGIALDPLARQVYLPGRAVPLPKREFDLLHLLMSRAGRVVTREESTRHLYRWGQDIGSNAVDVHIHSLRRRFSPDLIRTVRGEGYVLG